MSRLKSILRITSVISEILNNSVLTEDDLRVMEYHMEFYDEEEEVTIALAKKILRENALNKALRREGRQEIETTPVSRVLTQHEMALRRNSADPIPVSGKKAVKTKRSK